MHCCRLRGGLEQFAAQRASQAENCSSQHNQRARFRCRRAIYCESEVRACQAARTEEALVSTSTRPAGGGRPSPLRRETEIRSDGSPIGARGDVEALEIQPVYEDGTNGTVRRDAGLAAGPRERSSRDRAAWYAGSVVVEGQGPPSDRGLDGMD